jgi:hypothetical protein
MNIAGLILSLILAHGHGHGHRPAVRHHPAKVVRTVKQPSAPTKTARSDPSTKTAKAAEPPPAWSERFK